jgi:hypothetical protein
VGVVVLRYWVQHHTPTFLSEKLKRLANCSERIPQDNENRNIDEISSKKVIKERLAPFLSVNFISFPSPKGY